MRFTNLIYIFIFLIILTPFAYLDGIDRFDTVYNQNLDFDVIKAKRMDVDVLITVPIIVDSFSPNSTFTLRTPVFVNTRTQTVNLEAYYLEDGEKVFATFEYDEFNNRYAVFEVKNVNRNIYEFYIEANIVSQNNISYSDEIFKTFQEIEEYSVFTEPTRYINSDRAEIRTVSNYLKKHENILKEVTNITNWVYNYLEYDLSYSTKLLEATNVLDERRGVCSEYSILAAAILRDRGIPTRYVTGYANSTVEWQAHAWLEIYIPNQGWLPIDPTFGEVGFVDASHLLISRSKDPFDVKDRVTAFGDLSLRFGEKRFQFIINDQKSFSDLGYSNAISINVNFPEEIKEKSAFYIDATIKNTLRSPLTILFILNLHNDFKVIYPTSKSEIVYLSPFEEKTIRYYVIGDQVSVPENFKSMYNFFFISQIVDYVGQLSVYKDDGYFQEAFFVKEPLIYFKDGRFYFDLKVINYTEDDKNLTLNIDNGGELFEKNYVIPSKDVVLFSENFEYTRNSVFKFDITGDYEFSDEIKIFDDVPFIIDVPVDVNNGFEDVNNIPDVNNNFREDLENNLDSNNNFIVGILIVVCFFGLVVFMFFMKKNRT